MSYAMYASDAASLRRSWIPLIAWGIGFVAFGVVIIGWPAIVAGSLLLLVGVLSVLGGIVWVSWAISLRRASESIWVVTTVPGVLLIAFGVFALLRPLALASFLQIVAGVGAIAWGFADLVSAWGLRSFFSGWWLRLIRGLVVAGLGLLVVFNSPTALKALSWLVGALPILIGVVTIWMAIMVQRLPKTGPAVVVSREVIDAERPDDSPEPSTPALDSGGDRPAAGDSVEERPSPHSADSNNG